MRKWRESLKNAWIRLRFPPISRQAPSGLNVISFSLWGDHPKYLNGALENIKLQKEFYPEWICRFYVSEDVPLPVQDAIRNQGAQIIAKPRAEDFQGLYWRFEAAYDAGVSRFLVRDCDSRLNAREAAAVAEWMESGLPFHAMRDHPDHGIPVLGGLWGATGGFMPDFQKRLDEWTGRLQAGQHHRGRFFYTDQDFLSACVWPRVQHCHLAHTSSRRFSKNDRPFSIALPEGQFVGQQFDENNLSLIL